MGTWRLYLASSLSKRYWAGRSPTAPTLRMRRRPRSSDSAARSRAGSTGSPTSTGPGVQRPTKPSIAPPHRVPPTAAWFEIRTGSNQFTLEVTAIPSNPPWAWQPIRASSFGEVSREMNVARQKLTELGSDVPLWRNQEKRDEEG